MRVFAVMALCAALGLVIAPAMGVSYTGTLSGDGGGITGTAGWNVPATSLSFTVTQVGTEWQYNYVLSLPTGPGSPDLTHLIVERSADLWSVDVLDYNGPVLYETYGPGAAGQHAVPDLLTGIKFDEVPDDTYVFSVTIQTPRTPMWGDFYGAGGRQYIYNEGFTDPDWDPLMSSFPLDPAGHAYTAAELEALSWHILVPNTGGTVIIQDPVIPEPLTMLTLSAGVLGLGGYIRKRNARTAS